MFVTGPRFSSDYTGMTVPHAELVERAKPIAEVAKRNALQSEAMRRMPDENIHAIMNSGLMPLLRPKIFGGYEGDWITHIDVVSEVARFCGATGWALSFLVQHQFYLSYFPIETQRAVYDAKPDPKIVTSFAPTGKAKRVPGGFEVNGRWIFGSVGDHCDWAILSARVADGDAPALVHNFLLEPGQFRIDPTWNSIGLKGSGSNDILVDTVFVPDDHSYRQVDALAGKAPGSLFHDGRLYRGPLALNGGFGVMAPLHGICRGVYESFVGFTREKVALFTNQAASDTVVVQNAIGESKAEIDLAYLLTEKLSATAFKDDPVTVEDITRTRRDFIVLQRLMQRAVDRLFSLAGARGLDEGLPMQRLWRDFHAISHHVTFAMPSLQSAGRADLGLDAAPGDILVVID